MYESIFRIVFLRISGENSARARFHIFVLKFLNSFLRMHEQMLAIIQNAFLI